MENTSCYSNHFIPVTMRFVSFQSTLTDMFAMTYLQWDAWFLNDNDFCVAIWENFATNDRLVIYDHAIIDSYYYCNRVWRKQRWSQMENFTPRTPQVDYNSCIDFLYFLRNPRSVLNQAKSYHCGFLCIFPFFQRRNCDAYYTAAQARYSFTAGILTCRFHLSK